MSEFNRVDSRRYRRIQKWKNGEEPKPVIPEGYPNDMDGQRKAKLKARVTLARVFLERRMDG